MCARPVTILPLQDAPDAMPRCARWLNDEWGKAYGYGSQDTADWLREIIAPGSDEAALVALDRDGAVGICLMVACDIESRAELTPWVSGLYVRPDHRGRSISSKLLTAVQGTARAGGAANPYLYTHSAERLCLRLGWRVMGRLARDGSNFALMVKALD